jgi:hypothetical protein
VIAGATLIVIGTVLSWDSMLWLFPESYGVPCSDWKELMIALPTLGAGWLLTIGKRQAIASKWTWFAGKSSAIFPLTLVAAVLVICSAYKVEIGGAYWFTRSDIVTLQSGWKAGKQYSIRLRYALPSDGGVCP